MNRHYHVRPSHRSGPASPAVPNGHVRFAVPPGPGDPVSSGGFGGVVRSPPLYAAILALCVAAGCAGSSEAKDIAYSVDPNIATVIHVTWSTAGASTQQIAFGVTDGYGMLTPAESAATTSHEATLLGLPADTAVHFGVVGTDGTPESDDQTAQTNALPSGLMTMTLDSPITNPNVGPFLLTSLTDVGAETASILVLDTSGNIVWYQEVAARVLSVRPTPSGGGVGYVAEHPNVDASTNTVEAVQFTGIDTSIPLPWAHHDLQPINDTTWAVIQHDFKVVDGTDVAGDRLVAVGDDGGKRLIWDAFDTLTVARNDGWNMETVNGAVDWIHANGVAFDPTEGTYLLSLFASDEVVKIDGPTGTNDWVLGGTDSNFTFTDDLTFGPQHAPEFFSGGVRLFDNATSTGSMAAEYTLDTTAMTATRTWDYQPQEPLWTPVLGDVHRFDDGSALTSWGVTNQIVACDADGNPAGNLSATPGEFVGQVTVLPSLYPH